MGQRILKAGSTSQIITVVMRDSTTGAMKTGLAYGSVTYSWTREGDNTRGNGTCVDATLDSFTDHGWKLISDANQAGKYQFGVPNAAIAAGAVECTITFSATGCIDAVERVVLTATDLQDAQRMGLAALPASSTLAVKPAVTLATGDVSGNLNAQVKGIDADAISATAIANGAIDNATFAADVGSTVYASNILALAANKALANTVTPLLPVALGSDGYIKASLWGALGTALTEGAGGRIVAAIKKFFDVATPVATVASVDQTDDAAANAAVAASQATTAATQATNAAASAAAAAVPGDAMTLTAEERTAIRGEIDAHGRGTGWTRP